MKPTVLFLDLLQDNEGKVYWFMFCVDNHKLMNFKFWEFVEMMGEFNIIFRPADCNNCPYYEEGDDEEP